MTNKAIVRCRCGHQVLAREVLRTDLYERAVGREYVYVKYRCRRCKRLGEAFVAESRWDWSILEPAQNEMSDSERDQFLDADVISAEEVLDFHRQLEDMASLHDLENDITSEDGAVVDGVLSTGEPLNSMQADDVNIVSGIDGPSAAGIEATDPAKPDKSSGAVPSDSTDLI